MKTEIEVRPIPASEAHPWILKKHYQKRLCMIIHAFGAYRGTDIIGVVTYGLPASPHLCRGICGEEWANNVLELNRLCCENSKDIASTLVGRSLRLLPKPTIVVSYADTKQGHVGYVYQATNWIYTGLSAKRMDAIKVGEENKHSRGKWGDDYIKVERSRKHRYLYFVCSKTQKKKFLSSLKYEILPYPKGESKRYDASNQIDTQTSFF
jgi:hypothetical protein